MADELMVHLKSGHTVFTHSDDIVFREATRLVTDEPSGPSLSLGYTRDTVTKLDERFDSGAPFDAQQIDHWKAIVRAINHHGTPEAKLAVHQVHRRYSRLVRPDKTPSLPKQLGGLSQAWFEEQGSPKDAHVLSVRGDVPFPDLMGEGVVLPWRGVFDLTPYRVQPVALERDQNRAGVSVYRRLDLHWRLFDERKGKLALRSVGMVAATYTLAESLGVSTKPALRFLPNIHIGTTDDLREGRENFHLGVVRTHLSDGWVDLQALMSPRTEEPVSIDVAAAKTAVSELKRIAYLFHTNGVGIRDWEIAVELHTGQVKLTDPSGLEVQNVRKLMDESGELRRAPIQEDLFSPEGPYIPDLTRMRLERTTGRAWATAERRLAESITWLQRRAGIQETPTKKMPAALERYVRLMLDDFENHPTQGEKRWGGTLRISQVSLAGAFELYRTVFPQEVESLFVFAAYYLPYHLRELQNIGHLESRDDFLGSISSQLGRAQGAVPDLSTPGLSAFWDREATALRRRFSGNGQAGNHGGAGGGDGGMFTMTGAAVVYGMGFGHSAYGFAAYRPPTLPSAVLPQGVFRLALAPF